MENDQVQIEEKIDYSSADQERDIETASRSLKAMSHPLRLMILCKLGEEEFSVQDIVDNVGTSQSNISQHLAILRDKGILSARKDASHCPKPRECKNKNTNYKISKQREEKRNANKKA